MRDKIKDYCVLAVMCVIGGVLASALKDWLNADFKFMCGFLVGAFYYDWYKKQ